MSQIDPVFSQYRYYKEIDKCRVSNVSRNEC